MKTKLTLKYSSFFFCNSLQLKKGTQVEIDTDTLTAKDISILNAYIRSGGIVSTEGVIPVVVEEVIIEEVKPEVTPETVIEVKEELPVEEKKEEETPKEEAEPTVVEEAPKKPTKRTTKKTK